MLAAACESSREPPAHAAIALPACEAGGPDADADGLPDACEHVLATTFAPVLVVSASACNVVDGPDGPRLGGGYLFVVHPRGDGARVGFLPAYHQDCGWTGPKCRIPGVSCAPHAGDSEFIAIDLRRDGERWRPEAVFLSAHCFGRSTASCRWYDGRELAAFEWHDGPDASGPVVWVADGKNGNYPSRAACDRGHTFMDTCGPERVRYRYPIAPERNIGSRSRPLPRDGAEPGCVGAEQVDPTHEWSRPGTAECFWQPDARFHGWQGAADGVTPYERYLREIAAL